MLGRDSLISARELLGEVIAAVPARVGWPDDETDVRVRSPAEIRSAFAECLTGFREHWAHSPTVIDIGINTYHRSLAVRVKQLAVAPKRSDVFPPSLKTPFSRLDRVVRSANGKTEYWGNNNYFGLMLPLHVPPGQGLREDFPELETNDWDQAYRQKLADMSWEGLRCEAFRFCNHVQEFTRVLEGKGDASILVPSVGLCVHPWLFASAGVRTIATDISPTALAAVSNPEKWSRIYGAVAHERWDIQQFCVYGGVAHPGAFAPVLAIEDADVANELRQRIEFRVADWTALPVDPHSIDLVFSTNALPRDDQQLMERVLLEWQRVLKPNGHLFLAIHNPGSLGILGAFNRYGWVKVDSFDPESTKLTYQPYFSSG